MKRLLAACAAIPFLCLAGPAVAAPGVPDSPGEVTPHPFRPALAWECADAHETVGERMPGVTRDFLEHRYGRAGCREMLIRVEATTPTDGDGTEAGDGSGEGACRRMGRSLADGEMPSEPREALARTYRRSCAEGATPRDWTGAGTRTPG